MNIETALSLLNEMVEQGVMETYALGGAVAAANYLEPMSTLGVDVFVRLRTQPGATLQDPTPIFAFLAEKGHGMEGGYAVVDGWPVQFLAPPGELGEEALRNANTVDVDGIPVRIFRAEHLAAIALETGRAKDKARLLAFLESPDFDLAAFEDAVSRHALNGLWVQFKRDFGIAQ
ncbi:MAG: hypothetical protein H0W86_03625 [Armatimonadetes bacterium]|nr:hypothetical protein [Armatimonadota bacterium]